MSVLALDSTAAYATASRTSLSIPARIAIIDCVCLLNDRSPAVVPYRRAFAALTSKCIEKPIRIANQIEVAHKYLARSGISVTRLYIMRQVNRAFPISILKTRCAEVVSAWIVLATKK